MVNYNNSTETNRAFFFFQKEKKWKKKFEIFLFRKKNRNQTEFYYNSKLSKNWIISFKTLENPFTIIEILDIYRKFGSCSSGFLEGIGEKLDTNRYFFVFYNQSNCDYCKQSNDGEYFCFKKVELESAIQNPYFKSLSHRFNKKKKNEILFEEKKLSNPFILFAKGFDEKLEKFFSFYSLLFLLFDASLFKNVKKKKGFKKWVIYAFSDLSISLLNYNFFIKNMTFRNNNDLSNFPTQPYFE